MYIQLVEPMEKIVGYSYIFRQPVLVCIARIHQYNDGNAVGAYVIPTFFFLVNLLFFTQSFYCITILVSANIINYAKSMVNGNLFNAL